jgi:putative protease
MELLAPAGSKESFLAGINAGADAIYVGTKKFNARMNADNLNFYDLEVLINHAREKNVKVFIVFNTLLKHEEMNDAVNTIASIDKLNPDGIIVQDLGIARIISEYFPNLPLHASTQLATHNSLGVDTLANMGFKRVVLARELSFAEIKAISNHPKAEIEIFAHGALCFSISGMCFFSSVIGGYSGNRGLCTQPCRRIWHSKKQNAQGYLFSPKDFELADFIDKLKTTGVKSLKIEGRMRSSEYVYKVVKAYRMLLDSKPENFQEVLKESKLLIASDFARKKSSCLFSGRDETLFEPKNAQCLGKEIGKIISISQTKIKIETNEEIFAGDRLRLSNPMTDNTKVFKLINFEKDGNSYSIEESFENFSVGNPVFKASSNNSDWDEKIIEKKLDEIYNEYSNNEHQGKEHKEYKNTYTSLIARLWQKNIQAKETIWAKIDHSGWLSILSDVKNFKCLILAINKSNFNSFKNELSELTVESDKLAIELPPFIAQREIQDYKNIITYFMSLGVEKFILNNISQIALFDSLTNSQFITKIAGNYLYVWNGYSARALKEHGFEYFCSSYEDEFLNIRRLANCGLDERLIVPIFGYPVITRSRMLPKEAEYGIVISDKKDIELKQLVEYGMNILITKEPVMLFNAIDKLKLAGIKNFEIDLSFVDPNKKILDEIIQNFDERKNFENSLKFNFKRGIK